MDAKHTPGPWHVPKDIPGPDKWMVADCCGITRRSTAEEKSNAQLIAAAPDMLAALMQIMEEGITGPSCDAARAADSLAEKAAESEKEYQAAWGAGNRWTMRSARSGSAPPGSLLQTGPRWPSPRTCRGVTSHSGTA